MRTTSGWLGTSGIALLCCFYYLLYTQQSSFSVLLRAAEMPGLASMHTVWMREHNRIAAEILQEGDLEGQTDEEVDEEVYQRARCELRRQEFAFRIITHQLPRRKAVIAEMQNVVYGEYLPKILGEEMVYRAGLALPPEEDGRTR